MMDMALIPTIEAVDIGLSSLEKGNLTLTTKPRKKTMTSVYLKFFETAADGKSRRCKFCGQNYSIATATGNYALTPKSSLQFSSFFVGTELMYQKLSVDFDHKRSGILKLTGVSNMFFLYIFFFNKEDFEMCYIVFVPSQKMYYSLQM